ncbi:trehalase [Scenedesmus sp. PABB004]|nr:trehalase [Scenedesmus sp. PABB004]
MAPAAIAWRAPSHRTAAAAAAAARGSNRCRAAARAPPRAAAMAAPPPPQPPAARAAAPDVVAGGLLAPALAPLLAAIQEARLFADSKHAVYGGGRPRRGPAAAARAAPGPAARAASRAAPAGRRDLALRAPVAEVAAAFDELRAAAGGRVGADALRAFVDARLAPPGSDLVPCVPPDWTPAPPGFLARLAARSDPDGAALLELGRAVHGLWRELCREVSPSVRDHPERHSLLALPNPTVVPGDRFRETYYWDSYWALLGLLASGLTRTAAGLVGNLLALAAATGDGRVPNGGRVYYLNRSQPPLLGAMVRLVAEAGADDALPARALPALLAEHAHWTRGPKALRVAAPDGTVHALSRYWADWAAPRPESQREDEALAAQATGSASPSHPPAAQLYRELASGAESGWDYSSRWLADGASLATIRTTQIVPADLNAWLFLAERNIAWAARRAGDAATAQRFDAAADARRGAIQALLWDAAAGMWRDGILEPCPGDPGGPGGEQQEQQEQQQQAQQQEDWQRERRLRLNRCGVFASNFVGLWAGLTEGDEAQGAAVVRALDASGLVRGAGVAASLAATGQQWDAPNGWPPLQHMLIEGAAAHGGAAGAAFAARLARAWVRMNLAVWRSTGHMHEKYDLSAPHGGAGGGGEYAPQVGFAWSNGVLLHLLDTFDC